MQPPVIFENIREAVNRLKSEAMREQAAPVQALPKVDITDEYVERIQKWMNALPPLQQCRQFTINEVIALATLPGHFRPNASLRYTGEALRRCGFKQKRDWTAAGRNKRYWKWSQK